jgi:tetratricopeptide (TPR) repeat protein
MNSLSHKPLARRTLLVLAALTALAVASFAAVSRLVTRLKANEKRIAWHAYEAGLAQVQSGYADNALDDFRAALSYDRDNPEYQLSLARALRDTGRLDESEAYLLHLWSAAPQDSTINLALARLAARRHSIDDATRYYHSAIYGFWPNTPDENRRRTRFELIEFLLQQNAFPQAQAELIALAQIVPPDAAQHLTVADLFLRAHDDANALAQYESALKLEPKNAAALAGAGAVAFQMGRYRTAKSFLQKALDTDPQNSQARDHLQTTGLVLATDPFLRRISDAERNRRVIAAFNHAGDRLKSCAEANDLDLSAASTSNPGNDLTALWSRWQLARPQLRQLNSPTNVDLPDTLMDLVFQIEQQTTQLCGQPTGVDLALVLISRDRETVDE